MNNENHNFPFNHNRPQVFNNQNFGYQQVPNMNYNVPMPHYPYGPNLTYINQGPHTFNHVNPSMTNENYNYQPMYHASLNSTNYKIHGQNLPLKRSSCPQLIQSSQSISNSCDTNDSKPGSLPQKKTKLSPVKPSQFNDKYGVPIPQIQNVVSTANLGTKLNLVQIAEKAKNSEYNPRRFSAAIMRIRNPRTTALIFSSGKLVCTGAKSLNESKLAVRKFARIVQKLGFKAKFLDFKIQNIVASCGTGFPIHLAALQVDQSDFVTYEAVSFPGLVYRIGEPKLIALVFQSGKVVITGAKEEEDLLQAFNSLYPILKTFENTLKNKILKE